MRPHVNEQLKCIWTRTNLLKMYYIILTYIECLGPIFAPYILKNKGSLLALMIPLRICNVIHAIFPFHTRFFIEKGSSDYSNVLHTNTKMVHWNVLWGTKNGSSIYGIAAKKTKKKNKQQLWNLWKSAWFFRLILTFTFGWQLANLEFLFLPC